MRRLIASLLTLSFGIFLFFIVYMGATDPSVQNGFQSWFIGIMPKAKQ